MPRIDYLAYLIDADSPDFPIYLQTGIETLAGHTRTGINKRPSFPNLMPPFYLITQPSAYQIYP